MPTKYQEPYNVFVLQTAPDQSFDKPIEELSKFDVEQLLKDICEKILRTREEPIPSLTKIFKDID